MDNKKLSHDIKNAISRLEIMHDIAREKKFDMIPKEEIQKDFTETIEDLKKKFEILLNQ